MSAKSEPIRKFETGATRDTDNGKFDYEGFLCPLALREYAAYMHQHRIQQDGNLRDADNWQKGIPKPQYMKSMLRHVVQVWLIHRGHKVTETYTDMAGQKQTKEVTMPEALCAVVFNAFGYLHEFLKDR